MILLLSILFTVILVLGIKIVTHDGMALEKLRVRAEASKLKIFEVLLTCEWCMPTLWSIAGYAVTYFYIGSPWNIFEHNLWFYPITVCASSVIAGTIWTFILYILEKAEGERMKNEIFKLHNYDHSL